MKTNNLKAKIHIAKKQLGMDEDTYRAVLKRATGKSSSKAMSVSELHQAIAEFKQLGFKPKHARNKNKGPRSRQPVMKNGYEHKRESQGDKIRALWLTMAEKGIVRSAEESALRNYIRRMTHNKYSAPQFCPPQTASRIIEALKKWQARGLKEQSSCK